MLTFRIFPSILGIQMLCKLFIHEKNYLQLSELCMTHNQKILGSNYSYFTFDTTETIEFKLQILNDPWRAIHYQLYSYVY